MEKRNLIQKTTTFLLIMLALLVPVSATTLNHASTTAQVTDSAETVILSFTYGDWNSTANETITISVTGSAVQSMAQTYELDQPTGFSDEFSLEFLLSQTVAASDISVSVTGGSANFSDNLGTVALTVVNTGSCQDLVTNDGELEDEYNPGDTVTLELELDNAECTQTYSDVVFEAWLEDSEGRISSVEDTAEFNLGTDEEDTISFSFTLAEDADADETYVVHVEASADEADSLFERDYSFDVEREEHSIIITDVRYDTSAHAGETVDVAVTMLNNGQGDEDNVRISLSVAGVTQTSNYFTIEEDEEVVRYFTVTLPSDASGDSMLVVQTANSDTSDAYTGNVDVSSTPAAATSSDTLSEAEINALLEARLASLGDSSHNGISMHWVLATLVLVALVVYHRRMPATPAKRKSGRKKSQKVYY